MKASLNSSTINTETISTAAWVTRTPLMKHQDSAVVKLFPYKIGALFMEMGTGKTRTAIELATLRQEKIDKVVWFCPVSVKHTIAHEIQKHTSCKKEDIYIFNDKTDDKKISRTARWYIVGIESMSYSARQIHSVASILTDKTMAVCDESTYIKGHRSNRSIRLAELAKVARYRLLLTGTPFTQGPVDLFAQMRFLSLDVLGYKSFYSFSNRHLVYSERNPQQIVGSKNVKYLAERINPIVYQVTKKECLDLPEKYYNSHYVTLTGEQFDAYQQAKIDFEEDVIQYMEENGEPSSIAIFRLFSRLQSIVCGFDGDKTFESNRIEALQDAVQELSNHRHVVIWAKFVKSVDDICKGVHTEEKPAIAFDGRLSEEQRSLALTQWRQKGGYLVATQSMGGVGIDLTEASAVIFYANGFKYAERIQAEDRCHRIGQSKDVLYISLYARCGIEQKIEESIDAKENVLQRFRREIEKIKNDKKKGFKEFIINL
jgi:SNF2 family DNA or RNA helicase